MIGIVCNLTYIVYPMAFIRTTGFPISSPKKNNHFKCNWVIVKAVSLTEIFYMGKYQVPTLSFILLAVKVPTVDTPYSFWPFFVHKFSEADAALLITTTYCWFKEEYRHNAWNKNMQFKTFVLINRRVQQCTCTTKWPMNIS